MSISDDKEFNSKIKEEYKKHLSSYLSRLIKLYFLRNGNNKQVSYEEMYSMARKAYKLSEKDREEVYRNVNRILPSREEIFLANDNKNKPMYIITCMGKPRFML